MQKNSLNPPTSAVLLYHFFILSTNPAIPFNGNQKQA